MQPNHTRDEAPFQVVVVWNSKLKTQNWGEGR